MRAAIYTRISKDPAGKELGVERQLHNCTALAEQLGWEVVATFSDNDISAYNGKRRPGFEALLTDMKAGAFDSLIVWHVDRLYRSMKDLERLIDVAEVAGIQFKTVTSGDLDLGTSAGKMIARILGSVARQESEHHAERRTEANLERAVAGQWCGTGNRPYGYDKTGVPLEPEASLLRQAAADILAGRSLHSIAAEWNEAGYATTKGAAWSNLHLRRVLMNPRIAALRVHQSKIIGAGEWEPILDSDTWRGLCAYLSDPARRNGVAFERRYMLSGVARCGLCDQPMYACYPHGRDRPMVYACRPTAHVARIGAPLDELVELTLLTYLRGSGVNVRLSDRATFDVGALHSRRAALVAQKDELATLFTDGVLDAPGVRRESAKLSTKIAAVDAELAELARRSPVAELLKDGPDKLQKHWDRLSADMRGKIVDELMTVTVNPAPRGTKTFDPNTVDIQPKGEK
jgi:site-specific DNA recombinase